jgi:hypothetical protein
MAITSDVNGDLNFTLDIPDGTLAAGIHDVVINLSNGKTYTTKYVNKPNLTPAEVRSIYATAGTDLFAPIAQTFTLSENRDLTAISLNINKFSGTDDVIVQVREVNAGSLPSDKVLSESRVLAANIQAFGTFTKFTLSPVTPLLAGKEYCFVVLTRNINYTIGVAELGKPDSVSGELIASQPNAGVLLTSSNGSAWTAEQNKDLQFKLHAANYTSTTRTVSLGTVTGTNISDILVMATEELPDPDTSINYTVTLPDASTAVLDNLTATNLQGYKTGNFSVVANLKGTSKRSPVLFPNTRLEMGTIALTGNRFSLRFFVPDSFTYRVKLEAKIVGSGTFAVAVESGTANTYLAMTQISSTPLADGFLELVYERTSCTEVDSLNLSSIRLAATLPTAADRVYLRNLRGWSV